MNRFTFSLLSTTLLAFATLPACTDAGTGTSTAATTSGRARITVVVTGDTSASIDVTATDHADGEVAVTQHLTLAADGSAAINLELPEGDYGLQLTALAGDGVTVTASGSVDVAIEAQATIALSATLDVEGGGGLETEVDDPPAIDGLSIDVIGDLSLGLGRLGDATITVDASDLEGDDLTYFWSGLTIDGSIQGGATLAIDNDQMLAARLSGALDLNLGAQFHVVVQDSAGGAAVAEVTIGGNGTCLLCGTSRIEIVAGASVGIEDLADDLEACLDAHVACEASCDALIEADDGDLHAGLACNLACGADLATCVDQQ